MIHMKVREATTYKKETKDLVSLVLDVVSAHKNILVASQSALGYLPECTKDKDASCSYHAVKRSSCYLSDHPGDPNMGATRLTNEDLDGLAASMFRRCT
jgi:hypothetical protein